MKNSCLVALRALVLGGLGLFSLSSSAESQWILKPTFGLSQMPDLNSTTNGVGMSDGEADIQLDRGFTAGLGVMLRYNDRFASELAWEYRSNDSRVDLSDGQRFEDGNYASNLFFINGYYFLESRGRWQPYLGGGISWAQEIDIDLEEDSVEQSFSGNGQVGYQFFAGSWYEFSDLLSLDTQIRYGAISDIDLEGEGSAGEFQHLDYDTLTLQVGLNIAF